jgi:hypothetical protein
VYRRVHVRVDPHVEVGVPDVRSAKFYDCNRLTGTLGLAGSPAGGVSTVLVDTGTPGRSVYVAEHPSIHGATQRRQGTRTGMTATHSIA